MRAYSNGDGVLVVSFNSKAHAIGPQVLEGVNKALDIAEAEYRALVIWQNRRAILCRC